MKGKLRVNYPGLGRVKRQGNFWGRHIYMPPHSYPTLVPLNNGVTPILLQKVG